MAAQDLYTAMVGLGAVEGLTIDEQCYYFQKATGQSCPPPEDFGFQRDPATQQATTKISLADFATIADAGFGVAGNSGGGSPNLGTLPGQNNTGGSAGSGSGSGSGLGGMMPLLVLGLALWLLLRKKK